jgi:hypothetical protein
MKKGEKMGEKKNFFIKKQNPDRFNFSFPFVSNVRQVPPSSRQWVG